MNARFGDVNRHIEDVKDVLQAEMNLRFDRIDNKLETILKMLADHDRRIDKLERN